MRMSQKKFFEVLAECAKYPGFHCDCLGLIRQRRTGLCPVCVVGRMLTGKRYVNPDFRSAAKEIGLNAQFADRVVYAADDSDVCKYHEKAVAAIRRKLVRILGL